MSPQIITKKFQENDFYFNFLEKDLYINATQTAKFFGKKPDDWLRTKDTQKYIKAVQNRFANMRNDVRIDLVIVQKGGKIEEQGTWIHKKLALVFARWPSPEFAVWCDEVIEEILQIGSYSLQKVESPKPEISISETLSKSVESLHLIKLMKEQNIFDLFLLDGILENESPTKLLKIDFSKSYFLPTELGFLKGMSGAEMNLELQKKGFQIRENEKWVLTEKGREFGIEIGGKFSQLKWKLEALK
jgi:hypothetical protein